MDVHEHAQLFQMDLRRREGNSKGVGQLLADLLKRPVTFPVAVIMGKDAVRETSAHDELLGHGDKGRPRHRHERSEGVSLMLPVLRGSQAPSVAVAEHRVPAAALDVGAVFRPVEEADLILVVAVHFRMHGEVATLVQTSECLVPFIAGLDRGVVYDDRASGHLDHVDALAFAVKYLDPVIVEHRGPCDGGLALLEVDVLVVQRGAEVALKEMGDVDRRRLPEQLRLVIRD